MKKTAAWILSICMLMILLGGCGTEQPSPSSKDGSSEQTSSGVQIPEEIDSLIAEYEKLAEDNGFDYVIDRESMENSITGSKDFRIYTKEDDSYSQVSFPLLPNRSLDIFLNLEKDLTRIKDFTAATYMRLDKNLSAEQARQRMQDLYNSFTTEKGYSRIDELGDYYLYLIWDGKLLWFKCKYKDEIWEPSFKKEDYTPIDMETAKAPAVNKGALFYFEGTVTKSEIAHPKTLTAWSWIHIKTEDDQPLRLTYGYSFTPLYFAPGERYRFYGKLWATVDKEPTFTLDYCEKLS